MKLKVLVCAYACCAEEGGRFKGGEGTLGWNVIRQLARFHEVSVLTALRNRSGIQEELAREPVPGARFVYVDLPKWFQALHYAHGGIQIYAYVWQIKAYFVARRLHKQRSFDAFHHVTYANDWMASFIGALLPIPYFRGPCGGAQYIPPRFLRRFSRRGRFWERVRAMGQKILRNDPFFRLGQRRARAILVCTPEARATIPRRWRDKAELFPVNGITMEDLRLAEPHGRAESMAEHASGNGSPSNGNPKEFRVLSAGKLLELKAFDLAIRAFHRFAQNTPEATFTLVGDGPELARLNGLIATFGLTGRARIEKWMPRVDLLREMARSDVFIFPSLRDGGGAVVIEAMAAGNPIVCLNLAGPGLHVTDTCGIRVAADSPDQAARDMAEALVRLHADPELRLRMGKAARERVEQLYHWDRQGERLLRIYRNVLGGPEQDVRDSQSSRQNHAERVPGFPA